MTSVTPLPQHKGDGEYLPVRRARVEHTDLFDVKREELDLIEAGLNSTPTTLSFATFSASIAISCLTAMVTIQEYKWPVMEYIFSGTWIPCLILALFLFGSWYRSRASQKDLICEIRRRMRNGNGHLSGEE